MNALPKRSFTVLLGTVLLPVLFASCEEAPTEGNDPGEVAQAPPGACSPWPGCKDDDDGGDDDGSSSSGIIEYWVDHDAGPAGEDMIHVVVGQDVGIDTDVVYDYFGNGVRDHDGSTHYEWEHFGLGPYPVEEVASGVYHVDIPWDGDELNQEGFQPVKFPDQPMTDLDGSGADPFAFKVEFMSGGDVKATFNPGGVIVDGSTGGHTASPTQATGHSGWEQHQVHSYGTYAGDPPTTEIHVDGFTVNSFTCTVEGYTVRGGGPPRTEYRTILQAELSVELNEATDPSTHFHFVDGSGNLTPRLERYYDSGTQTFSPTLADTLDGDRSDEEYRVWMDYLYAANKSGTDTHAYDPASNSNSGFSTISRSFDSQDLHDWAVVESGQTATCQ